MKQTSDIQLGGTLLSVATLVCGGLAVVALIPLLHWTPRQSSTDSPQSALPDSAVHEEQQRFHEFRTDLEQSEPLQASADSDFPQDVESERSSSSEVFTRGSPAATAPDYSVLEQPTSAEGVQVPVTVHPVTVNVDGSALAEQLSVVASAMGDMLAAHREEVRSHQVATASPTTERRHLNDHEERLAQLDASVRELSRTVESLRTESRTADTRLTEEFRRVKLASNMLQEFRRTLAEHRQLLTDSSRSLSPSAARIARHPDAEIDSRSEKSEELLIPEHGDSDSEFPLWDNSEDLEALDGPDVPLPPDAEDQTSVITSPPASVLIQPGENPPSAPQHTTGSTVQTSHTAEKIVPGRARIGVTGGTQRSSAQSRHRPSANSEGRSDSARSLHAALPAAHQPMTPSPAAAPAGSADQSTRPAEPVVFEQTFKFALPPATDPLASVQNQEVDGFAQIADRSPESFLVTAAQAPAPFPAPKLHTVPLGSGPGFSASAGPVVSPDATQPTNPGLIVPFTSQGTSSRTFPPSIRAGTRGTVESNAELSTDHGRQARGILQLHRDRRPSAAMDTTKRPALLHRLASGIRKAGQSRTVD